jgi:hypothetical protein
MTVHSKIITKIILQHKLPRGTVFTVVFFFFITKVNVIINVQVIDKDRNKKIYSAPNLLRNS